MSREPAPRTLLELLWRVLNDRKLFKRFRRLATALTGLLLLIAAVVLVKDLDPGVVVEVVRVWLTQQV